jgi:broad specificity polyphosphatase/5'/3'-nucleotidase SurE
MQMKIEPEHGTDVAALEDRCIAVTPLKIDITDGPTMTGLVSLFEKS